MLFLEDLTQNVKKSHVDKGKKTINPYLLRKAVDDTMNKVTTKANKAKKKEKKKNKATSSKVNKRAPTKKGQSRRGRKEPDSDASEHH